MMELSITRAWNEATDFLKREFGIVFLIALLLICLPGAAVQYAMPATVAPEPATIQEAWAQVSAFLVFAPVVIALGMIGTIAITYLAVTPGASVGEALAVGARRFIILLLAGMLVGLAAGVAFLPLFFLVWPGADAQPAPGPLLLIILVILVLVLALAVKLLPMTPVAAAERGGPLALITRSWALTRGHFWKLLGFMILFWLVAAVVLMVASLIVALIVAMTLGSPLVPNSAAFFTLNLIGAAMQAVASLLFAAVVARIYTQLTGAIDRDIFT